MDRNKLLDDIRVLASLLARAEDHERRADDADERDSHIEMQVTRLEEAALKVERRRLELDAIDDHGAEQAAIEAERRELDARLANLHEKSNQLRRAALENEVLDAAAHAARPAGVPARLRRTLLELVRAMHSDPEVPKADIRPFQHNLAELVRARRDDLERIAARVNDARQYLISVATLSAEVLEGAQQMAADESDELPFADQRSLASTRTEMARVAIKEARQELEVLAHDWPELSPLATKPDWKKLPFGQLTDLLTPRDAAMAARQASRAARLAEATEMAQAITLWLEELRRAVSEAPPPV